VSPGADRALAFEVERQPPLSQVVRRSLTAWIRPGSYADLATQRRRTRASDARRQDHLAARAATPSAMRLLRAGVDSTVIALWLGHESTRTTDIYLHADLTLKERALARTAPPHTRARRYRAPDSLLAFLDGL
jgi:integrase/recombinase XerD